MHNCTIVQISRASRRPSARATPEWGKLARDLTNKGGVDLALEVGGIGTLNESIRATRFGGTIALIGVLAGALAQNYDCH